MGLPAGNGVRPSLDHHDRGVVFLRAILPKLDHSLFEKGSHDFGFLACHFAQHPFQFNATELLPRLVRALEDPIGGEDHQIAGLEVHGEGLLIRRGRDAKRGPGGISPLGRRGSRVPVQQRSLTGRAVAQRVVGRVDLAEECRDEAVGRKIGDQQVLCLRDDPFERCAEAQRHAHHRAELRGRERRADAVTGCVREQEKQAAVGSRDHVIDVPGGGVGRSGAGVDLVPVTGGERFGEECAVDFGGDSQISFHPEPGAAQVGGLGMRSHDPMRRNSRTTDPERAGPGFAARHAGWPEMSEAWHSLGHSWLSVADATGTADLWRALRKIPLDAVRTRLGSVLDHGDWAPYEEALRADAGRCLRERIPFEEVERVYGRLVADATPTLVADLAGSPLRLLAALDTLVRLVRHELFVLAQAWRDGQARKGATPIRWPVAVVGDGVIATDRQGRVTQMNLAAQQILGVSGDDVRGRLLDEVFQLVDPETGEAVPSRVAEVLGAGKVVVTPRAPILVTHDGAPPRSVVESIAPVCTRTGDVEGAVLVFREEDREVAHSRALEASEARTTAILEASLDAVITVDGNGSMSGFNAAAERMFAHDRDDVLGLGLADLLLPSRSRGAWAEAMGASLGERVETVAMRADRSEFPVELAVARIPVEGERALTCFVRDLTPLHRTQKQLRALAGRVESAREEERTRIARELHDELGQQLTAIRMDLGWLARRRARMPEEVVERLDAVSGLVEATFQLVRRLGTELRPGILDDLGLAAAIEWQAREFEGRSGIRVDVDSTEEMSALDNRQATAVFRIFQEILTNVGRHSAARRVSARLWRDGGNVRLRVLDDGRGIRPEEASNPDSLGLLGMRERASLLGGSLSIGAGPAGGTLVSLALPVSSDCAA